MLLRTPEASFFHTSGWARVLHESYNYKPLYFGTIEDSAFSVLVPVMEIRSLVTGKRGVSLPFTDYCGIVLHKKNSLERALEALFDSAKRAGWKTIELRDSNNVLHHVTPSSKYYVHKLRLKQNEKDMFSTFRESTKRNIRKAVRQGVHIDISNSLDAVKSYYALHCKTRKFHGLPPQPYTFFKKIYEHIIAKNKGWVILASHMRRAIAGAVFFSFRDQAIYKYGASDRRYQHLRASNLVMWEAIRSFAQEKCEELHFGRTDLDDKGLLQFKRGWGVEEEILNYHKYNLVKQRFTSNSARQRNFGVVFRNMPSPLLNAIGAILYRHVG